MEGYKTKMIVISGAAQSGKDTTARFIWEELALLGNGVKICHYADLLKYICHEFLGWNCQKDEAGREFL